MKFVYMVTPLMGMGQSRNTDRRVLRLVKTPIVNNGSSRCNRSLVFAKKDVRQARLASICTRVAARKHVQNSHSKHIKKAYQSPALDGLERHTSHSMTPNVTYTRSPQNRLTNIVRWWKMSQAKSVTRRREWTPRDPSSGRRHTSA